VYRRLDGQKGHGKSGDYIFSYGKGKKNNHLGTGFFVHYRIVSAVKRVEYVNDRMSCSSVRSLV